MKQFWFGMVDDGVYVTTFGCFAEADTKEAAIAIIKSKYPNSTIVRIVEI